MLPWINHRLESRLPGEISITSDDITLMAETSDNTTLMAESEDELKILLMKVKEESEKAGLKLNIQKAKVMAFSPITSWEMEGGKVEAVTDFLFLGSKVTVNGDCSYKFKRCFLLGRKAMTNLESIFKSRDITLPTGSI